MKYDVSPTKMQKEKATKAISRHRPSRGYQCTWCGMIAPVNNIRKLVSFHGWVRSRIEGLLCYDCGREYKQTVLHREA